MTALQREALSGYAFISPWIIGFLLFMAGPVLFSLLLSFCSWDGIGGLRDIHWVGISNFTQMASDNRFYASLWDTVYYTLFSVPLGIIAAIVVSLLMNQKIKGIALFRTIFYLPSVTAGVAAAILWYFIFQPQQGLLNYGINHLSALIHAVLPFIPAIHGPEWLADPKWSKPAFIIMSLWGIGNNMIIFLAGLQGIPEQMYEAAQIDGANSWQQFLNVTLPMLSPVIFFVMVLSIIGSFQVFTQAYILSPNGSPADSVLFYVLYLYQQAFSFHHFGYGSAMAWVLFVIILAATLVQFKFSGWVYYEGELKK